MDAVTAVTGGRVEVTKALHALAAALECLERGDCQQAAVRVLGGFEWYSFPILGPSMGAALYWNHLYCGLRDNRVTPAQLREILHQAQEAAWAM